MKLSEVRRQKHQELRQKQKQRLKRANREWVARNPQLQFSGRSFVFDPKTVLLQPHTWLFYRFFEKPLKTRLNELSQYEVSYKKIFPAFCDAMQKEYLIEVRLRWQFKRLLNAWLRRRMNKKCSDLVDPITLNPITHPIRVYDVKQRRSYVFEADSLNKAIKKNLYAHQYTVPGPKKPINILTNRPFTYSQLVSIHDQMLSTRCRMEDFASYRKWQFRLESWKLYMHNHIYMASIKEELYNFQSMDGRDMLEDFIKDMMFLTKIPLTEIFELAIPNAISWYPEHPLLQSLRALCVSSYESDTYQLNVGLLIANRFVVLFQPNYPRCSLWDQVLDRMKADSDAEQEMEAADVMLSNA